MPGPVRVMFPDLVRRTRIALDVTQQQLADAIGVSRGYLATVETGRANPTLAMVDRIAGALGIEIDLMSRTPIILRGHNQRDLVHARCSGYVDRRLRRLGWETAREVEVVYGRSHGWIDALAFDPRTGSLLIIEVKTRIDDVGAIERRFAWYERAAHESAQHLGWRPRRIMSWLVALASDEVETAIRANAEVVAHAFPVRATGMAAVAYGRSPSHGTGRGLALCDPASRRVEWLIRTRSDGRRSALPYADYGDAARRLGAG